jgi:nucleotide-binding universal stress UspA family protein
MSELHTSRPIVVGIDGSKAAVQAALWAVDEAVSRDVSLRLVYAVEQDGDLDTESDAMARKLSAAQIAIHRAATAIEATGQPVKIETEIAQGSPIGLLIRASASAALVCVGSLGLRHFEMGRIGSTAAALATSARCPVAVVRGQHEQPTRPADDVVVEVDGSPDNGVLLGAAMDEARLRNVGVRAVMCGQATPGDRQGRAGLDRRLARWRRRYPDLPVESVVVDDSLLDYVAHDRRGTGLLVVGADNRAHLDELFGPVGSAVLRDAQCSLLVANQRHL